MWFVVVPLSIVMIGLNFYITWVSLRWSYHKIWPSQLKGSRYGAVVVPFIVVDDKIVGMISMGTPNDGRDQSFNVAFNTMTAKFWLRSVDLCENKDCTGKNFNAFDGRRSSSYVNKNRKFKQKYGPQAEVNGVVAEDTVRFVGTVHEFFIEKQEFGEINLLAGNFDGLDGILGLGLVSPDNIPQEPFVWAFHKQAQMEAVFGIYIHAGKYQSEAGRLIFGGDDQDLTTGPINVHNVLTDNNGQYIGWVLPIDKVLLNFGSGERGDIQLSVNSATPAPMMEDISVPESDLTPLIDKIFAKANFQRYVRSFKCKDDWKKLPDLTLVIGGVEYVLNPEDYVVPINEKGEDCMVAISSAGGSRTVRLGRVFMKKYYTRFNIGTKQIQLIQAVPMS